MKNSVLEAPAVAADPKVFELMVVLKKLDDPDQERTECIMTRSNRVSDILALVWEAFPGWGYVESWEPEFEFEW